MAFQTQIRRARFVVGPFSSEAMAAIGQAVTDSILGRIRRGQTVDDRPAKPLKPGRGGHKGYPEIKTARGLQPIRDWTWRGRTLRMLKVKRADENRVVIGFIDPAADQVAHINNLRERAFGMSPRDRLVAIAAVRATAQQIRVVRVMRAA